MSGICRGYKWLGTECNRKLKKWIKKHVGTCFAKNVQIFFWVHAGAVREPNSLSECRPAADQQQREIMIEELESWKVPSDRGRNLEGRKVRVLQKEFKRLQEEFHDGGLLDQRGM